MYNGSGSDCDISNYNFIASKKYSVKNNCELVSKFLRFRQRRKEQKVL